MAGWPPVDTTGPCDWPVVECCDVDTSGVDPALVDMATDAAIGMLWNQTGRVFSLCDITLRPCRDDCPNVGSGWWPTRTGDGEWVNVAGCGCQGPCGCGGPLAQVTLPGPVHAVTEVVVDGAVLPADAYRVDNWQTVVRQDGGTWPACVHLGDPAPGGWQITYQYGRPVPAGGQVAAGMLACELLKGCLDLPCRLPRTAVSVARQGVTVGLPDIDTLLEGGRFGLFEVDAWVASVQPSVRTHYGPPSTPDLPQARMQTWPAPA